MFMVLVFRFPSPGLDKRFAEFRPEKSYPLARDAVLARQLRVGPGPVGGGGVKLAPGILGKGAAIGGRVVGGAHCAAHALVGGPQARGAFRDGQAAGQLPDAGAQLVVHGTELSRPAPNVNPPV